MTIISNDITSPDIALTVVNGDEVVVASGVNVTGANGAILADGTADIFLAPGAVAATYQGAVAVDVNASGLPGSSDVIVSQNAAVIASDGHGIRLQDGSQFLVDVSTIHNSGYVYGTYSGLELSGRAVSVVNTGEISASQSRVFAAIAVNDVSATITNSGVISAWLGIEARGTAPAFIVNTGSITAVGQAIATEGHAFIANSGHIAVNDFGGNAAIDGPADVVNTGTIIGLVRLTDQGSLTNYNAVDGIVAANTIVNSGEISRFVSLLGDGVYDGRGGTVAGSINGGDGDDTFFVDQNDAAISGGSGFDIAHIWATDMQIEGVEQVFMRGTADIDLVGSMDRDSMRGNGGSNVLTGEIGADTLFGLGGDDTLSGDQGWDRLAGGSGNDFVSGGGGSDTLTGGAGNDALAPGVGADLIATGDGQDVIIFDTIQELDGDRITDFERGADVIDLSGLGDLSWIGTDVFSGQAGEVRVRETQSGVSLVQIDRDGDGVLDAMVKLLGVTGLGQDDFLL